MSNPRPQIVSPGKGRRIPFEKKVAGDPAHQKAPYMLALRLVGYKSVVTSRRPLSDYWHQARSSNELEETLEKRGD